MFRRYDNYLEFLNDNKDISIVEMDTVESRKAVKSCLQYILLILPLTQADICVVMSHLNSYTRKKLNDKSPFDTFSSRYGFKLIDALGIKKINPNYII